VLCTVPLSTAFHALSLHDALPICLVQFQVHGSHALPPRPLPAALLSCAVLDSPQIPAAARSSVPDSIRGKKPAAFHPEGFPPDPASNIRRAVYTESFFHNRWEPPDRLSPSGLR